MRADRKRSSTFGTLFKLLFRLTEHNLNYIAGSYKPFLKENEQLSEEVQVFQKYASNWSSKEGAYSQQHSSKPITLAYGLNDSPIGLCAWIVEKFNSWSDNQGNIENVFSKDELLANVTLYWITQTIHSSIRIYNENSKHPLIFDEKAFVKVPVAFAKPQGTTNTTSFLYRKRIQY